MTSPSYRIVEYDRRWPNLFEEEKAFIVEATGIAPERVEHIGSTAVPGLGAKPIIDLMAGVPKVEDSLRQIEAPESCRIRTPWRDCPRHIVHPEGRAPPIQPSHDAVGWQVLDRPSAVPRFPAYAS